MSSNTTPADNAGVPSHEILFAFIAGIFLTSLTVGNVIGVTKFVDLVWFTVPVGLLAYPVTFLATDLICELYGRRRAQLVVWVGFSMNFFMLLLMWVGHALPNAAGVSGAASTFDSVFEFMRPNVIASMVAYLISQTVDVRLFHFWKRVTNGKHLWLRNNGSTILSQIIDTVTILTILYLSSGLGAEINSVGALIALMFDSYKFKFLFALLDTPLFYLGVYVFRDRMNVTPQLAS